MKSAHLFKSYRRVRLGIMIPYEVNLAWFLSGSLKQTLSNVQTSFFYNDPTYLIGERGSILR
jgi:hypothetical protein